MNIYGNMPILTEPGIKSLIHRALKETHNFRMQNISLLFNIGLFIFFTLSICGFLYYKYKGKQSPYEQSRKNRKKQEYIVSKLQQLAYLKKQKDDTMITNIPIWNDHPEINILTRNNV